MTDKNQPDQNKLLFTSMVSMLTMTAMHQLGKIINPATGKAGNQPRSRASHHRHAGHAERQNPRQS